jgi:hypothetical protein
MTTESETVEQLIDLVEGRLPKATAERLVHEMASDPAMSETHAWLAEFAALASRTTLVSPPSSTRARLESLLPQHRPLSDALDRVADYIGRLVRDVGAHPVVAGARGAALDARRQLLFDIGDDVELAIDLRPLTDSVVVSGQVLGDEPTRLARLVSDESTVEANTDDLGEFTAQAPRTSFLRLDLLDGQRLTTVDLTPFLDDAAGPPNTSSRHQEQS